MKKITLRDILLFFVGFSFSTLLWRYPMLLFAVILIIAGSLYVLRDKINWRNFKLEIRKRELDKCNICGSATKHYKTCPYYGKLRGK